MKLTTFLATSAIGFLAACGGSSTNGSLTETLTEVQDINEYTESLPLLAERDYKTSGSATYAGYMAVYESDEVEDSFVALGDASVNVNFGSGLTSGSAGNFQQIDLTSVDLESEDDIDIGSIRGSAIAGGFTVNSAGTGLTGTLTHVDGEVATYDLGVGGFDYYGANSEVLEVYGDGTSSAPGRADIDADFDFTGIDTTVSR